MLIFVQQEKSNDLLVFIFFKNLWQPATLLKFTFLIYNFLNNPFCYCSKLIISFIRAWTTKRKRLLASFAFQKHFQHLFYSNKHQFIHTFSSTKSASASLIIAFLPRQLKREREREKPGKIQQPTHTITDGSKVP